MDAKGVQESLEEHFSSLKGTVMVRRESRVEMDLAPQSAKDVMSFLKNDLGFTALSAITGSEESDCFSVIYHMSMEGKVILSIKVRLPKQDPSVQTVTGVFPCADAYERELIDLLGIRVEGIAPGNRYPLPDSWPQDDHPLRKDWKPREVPRA